jgi:hypothetical protein
MATSRPVRIARTASPEAHGVAPTTGPEPSRPDRPAATTERRTNVAGSQRVVRVTLVYLVVLVALFAAFILYDRSVPGGTSSPAGNGVFVFTGIFVAFALGGVILTLHPAPRAVEVAPDHVTVVGRWGGRRVLPPLESLSTRVVRRYPSGFLSDAPVEQLELWGRDAPLRTYLVEDQLFRGARVTEAPR